MDYWTTTNLALTELPATEAARAIRNNELSAVTLAIAFLEAIEAKSELNAFIAVEPDVVLRSARMADRRQESGAPLGPLHGVPVAVKDSIHVRGMATTNGTRALSGFRARTDAAVVQTFTAAGGIILGKTNMTELSSGWTSNNETFGPVRNPHDLSLVPGGSSGGSAVAVAAHLAPIAIGADTLGSIQVPASFCGVVGFRPTTGRYSNDGVFALTDHRFDQVGTFARTVDDILLMDGIFSSQAAPGQTSLDGVRIGIPPFYWERLDSTVRSTFEEALEILRANGAHLVEVDVPEPVREASDVVATIMLYETLPSVERYLASLGSEISVEDLIGQMGADTHKLLTETSLPPGRPDLAAYQAMVIKQGKVISGIRQYYEQARVTAVAFPAVTAPPPPIGEERVALIDSKPVSFFEAFGRNTALAPAAGMPALMVPVGTSSIGLPVGLEIVGVAQRDQEVLALGLAIEAALAGAAPGNYIATS